MVPDLHRAVLFYRLENLNHFFRLCSYALIEHHKNEDTLILPISFLAANESPVCKPKN